FASHAELRQPSDRSHGQMEAVDPVHDRHVEGRGGGALLLETVHMEIDMVRALIGQAMNEVWVAVIGEDDRPVSGEEGIELVVREAMRMDLMGLQRHQVDYVDDPDAQ